MRQIQCTCTEFWCVQCHRPAGPSALSKRQIQGKCFDLSHFLSESKCKVVNIIHTKKKKNGFEMFLNMKKSNKFTQQKIWISWCDIHMREQAPKAPCTVRAQYAECRLDIFNTLRVFTHNQSENNKLNRSVWITYVWISWVYVTFKEVYRSIYPSHHIAITHGGKLKLQISFLFFFPGSVAC